MVKIRHKHAWMAEAMQYSRQEHLNEGNVPEGVTKNFRANEDGAMTERLPYVVDSRGRELQLEDGDWVIREASGTFSVCPPDDFERIYEVIE